MSFYNLKCISENVNLDDYLELYSDVRKSMKNPEWLGTFEKNEIIDILNDGGKIWLYYYDNKAVCSMFYIPANNNTLKKHNILYDESVVAALGPIMVRAGYIGNGYQSKMMGELEKYCKKIGKQYIYTKAHTNNVYSINNMLKNGYILVDTWTNERGNMSAFIKKI